MIGAILGGAGIIGSALGIGQKKGSPEKSSSEQISGYYALPPEAQARYQDFLKGAQQYYNNPQQPGRYGQALNPSNNPYASQGLYEYQQANPDKSVRPLGVVEPLNSIQRSAIGNYSNPDYSMGGLSQYFNPFQEQVIDRATSAINRQADISRSNLLDRINASGGILGSSATGTQLAQQEGERLRALGDMNANLGAQGYREALGLRGQSLSDMLNAGNMVQQQNQGLLQAALPGNQAAYNQDYTQAKSLGQLLGLFPSGSKGTSSSMGEIAPSKNALGKGLGLAGSLFGGQFTGMMG
jgi:hypothetical protein